MPSDSRSKYEITKILVYVAPDSVQIGAYRRGQTPDLIHDMQYYQNCGLVCGVVDLQPMIDKLREEQTKNAER